MTWRQILFIILLFIALGLAGASDRADAYPRIDRAKAIAERVWHPNSPVSVTFAKPPADMDESVAGWATWNGRQVFLNSEYDWAGEPEVCDVLLHEEGHAVGWQDPEVPDNPATPEHEGAHSTNAGSVMYPTGVIDVSQPFDRFGRPAGPKVWDGVDKRCMPGSLAQISKRVRQS